MAFAVTPCLKIHRSKNFYIWKDTQHIVGGVVSPEISKQLTSIHMHSMKEHDVQYMGIATNDYTKHNLN